MGIKGRNFSQISNSSKTCPERENEVDRSQQEPRHTLFRPGLPRRYNRVVQICPLYRLCKPGREPRRTRPIFHPAAGTSEEKPRCANWSALAVLWYYGGAGFFLMGRQCLCTGESSVLKEAEESLVTCRERKERRCGLKWTRPALASMFPLSALQIHPRAAQPQISWKKELFWTARHDEDPGGRGKHIDTLGEQKRRHLTHCKNAKK